MTPRVLWSIAAACALAIAAASLHWIRENPMPSYWDEALYAKDMILDAQNPLDAYYRDPARPPMMRVAALPLTLLFGPSLTIVRVYSLSMMFAAAIFIALAVRRAAGDSAAALAFVMVIASPIVIYATRMFGTEYPLFFAIALALWALVTRRFVMLGIAIGIGLLSKSSFAVVVIPMLIAAAIVDRDARRPIVFRSIPIGLVMAATWWLHDPVTPVMFGIASGNFFPHSLGDPASLATLGRYAYETIRCAFGWLVMLAIVIATVIREKHRPFAAICLSAALPLIVLHYTSRNHNPRLIAPAVILIGAAAAVTARRRWIPLLFALCVLQAALIVFPRDRAELPYYRRGVTELMNPVEQWDWTRLRAFAVLRGMPRPRIAIAGETYGFNPPQIRYGWRGEPVAVRRTEVWRGKQFILSHVLERAADAQIIVVARGFTGDPNDGQTLQNEHNEEIAAALSRDPHYEKTSLDMGLRRPRIVTVFVRRGSA